MFKNGIKLNFAKFVHEFVPGTCQEHQTVSICFKEHCLQNQHKPTSTKMDAFCVPGMYREQHPNQHLMQFANYKLSEKCDLKMFRESSRNMFWEPVFVTFREQRLWTMHFMKKVI